MKTKIFHQIAIILGVLMFSTSLAQGQEIDNSSNKTPQEMHDMFMKKHKTNKLVGWIMVGSGVVMIVSGIGINLSEGWGEGNQNKGLGLSYLGGAITLTSIPFFISAGSNKRKARLALKGGTVGIGMFDKTNHLSVSITIPF